MNRSLSLFLTAATAALAVGGCAPDHSSDNAARRKQVESVAATLPTAPLGHEYSTDDGSPAGVIEIRQSAFSPASFNVVAGQALVWAFDDGPVAHHVVGDGFDSGVQASGRFSHTFAAAGIFAYHCSIHPAMKGSVTVTGH
jgi:plastocyanin